MKKKISKTIAMFILMIFPLNNYAQDTWDTWGDYQAGNYPYYNGNQYGYNGNQYGYGVQSYAEYEPRTYSTMDYSYDYSYNRPSSFGRWNGGNRGYSGGVNFGHRFDNSSNFSTGISSYQGTSTGPGPNGGYPGAPHGIYPTNYIDTSIYPNTYMQTQR